MNKDGLELCKNTGSVNSLDWQKAAGYVEYGYISRVLSADTVIVTRGVQDSVTPRLYTVRLLGMGSSIVEDVVEPQANDQVLLLFLHAHNDEELLDPRDREKSGKDLVVRDSDCESYTMFTGLGILMRTFKGRSAITRSYGMDADGAKLDERTNARVRKLFNKAFSVAFDAIKETSSDEPDDGPIDVYFGPHSPLNLESQAAMNVLIGMDYVDDSVESPAPIGVRIGSTSPVTVKSKSTLELAFEKGVTISGQTIKLDGEKITVTGGELNVKGTVEPKTSGPFNCIVSCPFSGSPHAGEKVSGT